MQLVYDVEEQAADRAHFRDAVRQATAERVAADVARLTFKSRGEAMRHGRVREQLDLIAAECELLRAEFKVIARRARAESGTVGRRIYRPWCRSWQGQWRWLDWRGLVQRAEVGLVWGRNWREILCIAPLAIESQFTT